MPLDAPACPVAAHRLRQIPRTSAVGQGYRELSIERARPGQQALVRSAQWPACRAPRTDGSCAPVPIPGPPLALAVASGPGEREPAPPGRRAQSADRRCCSRRGRGCRPGRPHSHGPSGARARSTPRCGRVPRVAAVATPRRGARVSAGSSRDVDAPTTHAAPQR